MTVGIAGEVTSIGVRNWTPGTGRGNAQIMPAVAFFARLVACQLSDQQKLFALLALGFRLWS